MAGFGAKVKLTVDRSSAAKAEFNQQINTLIKQIKISNKFTVLQKDMDRVRKDAQIMLNKAPIRINKIDCSGAMAGLRRDLQSIINSLSISNGVTITGLVDPSGVGSLKTDLISVNDAIADGSNKADQFNARISVLRETMKSLATVYQSAMPGKKNGVTNEALIAELNTITAKYTELKTKIEAVNSSKHKDVGYVETLQQEAVALQAEIAALQQKQAALANDAAQKNRSGAETKELTIGSLEYNNAIKQTTELLVRVRKAQEDWTKAKNGHSSAEYEKLALYEQRLISLITSLTNGKMSVKDFKASLSAINSDFTTSASIIKKCEENTKSFADRFGGLATKFASWLTVSQVVMMLYRALRRMVTAVIDVDTAMTELRKVTNETDAAYEKFLDNAGNRAKKLGATISDTVNATADFARLGHGVEDAAVLADAAIVYKNIGDGIEDISQASESIISTMQAFGIEASNVMTIVDKFNHIGNNFAISSAGIGDALLNSAASLHAAGNTLDESIALITAANEVIQNPEKVGTALKTMSMYIRASKTEAEEAGIATDGMANSVSELRQEILALTGNRVDIMIDDNTFKSTVEIIGELAKVWDSLTGTSRTNITELIGGGVRNANVINALISNYETVEEVLIAAAGASGSAMEENEKQLDSIQGKINQFKATFQDFSLNFIEAETVKIVVNFGTALMGVASAMAKIDLFLPTIIAAVVAFKSFQKIKNNSLIAAEENAATASLVQRLLAEKSATDAMVISYQMLNEEKKKDVLSTLAQIAGTEKLTKEEYEAIAAKLNYTTATIGAKTATDSLNVSLKSLMASNPIGWIMLAVSLIPTLINGIKSVREENKRAAEENYNNLVEESKEAAEKQETLTELINRYKELANTANGVWNSQEIEEVRSIQSQIVELTGDQAEALDLVNGKLDDEYNKLLSISKAEAEIALQQAEAEYSASQQRFNEGYKRETNWYNGSKESDHNAAWYIRRAYEELNGVSNKGSGGSTEWWGRQFGLDQGNLGDIPTALEYISDYNEGLEKLYEWRQLLLDAGKLTDPDAEAFFGAAGEVYNTADALAYLNSKIAEFEKIIGDAEAARQRFFSAKATNAVLDYIATNDINSQNAFDEYINSILNDPTISREYAEALINSVAAFFPQFELPEAVRKEAVKRQGELYSEIINAIPLGGGNFSAFSSRVNDWINSMDLSTYKTFVSWWERNKDSEVVTSGLDAMQGAFARYCESVSGATHEQSLFSSVLADTKTDIEKLDAVFAKLNPDDATTLGLLTVEDMSLLLELMPELRAEMIAYEEAIRNGANAEEEQIKLIGKFQQGYRALRASNLADAMEAVVTATEKYGGESYQAQSAMAQLAMYCPTLVSQLYNAETGMYALGNSAASAKAAILGLNGIGVNIDFAASEAKLRALDGEVIAAASAARQSAHGKGDGAAASERYRIAKEQRDQYAAMLEEARMWQDASLVFEANDTGGGGGSSKTPADNIKDAFDALSSSIEISIQKEEEFFENGKKNLDSEVMRKSLMQQVAYYQQIQREAASALESVKEYYRGQGMSEGAIEQQSQVQDLTNDYLDATKDVKDAVDRMTSAIVDAFGEAIDSMQSVYDTLHKAADEYASSGYIAVDTLQEIISHGVEYLSLLQDENGQLTINEENIKNVIAARTEQMAVETALAYVEAIHAANAENNVTELNRLLHATQDVTSAQWGLVYATLALEGLDEDQNRAALHVIDSLRAMSESAQRSIFETADNTTDALKETREELEKMQSGVNDILEYTMEMLEHEVEQQIEALEQQKEDYAEIIELKKEALDATKEESDYQEEVADKVKELAKLQERINILSLDDSRDAQAQRIALQEEMADLQEELAELQGDHAIEAQKESLDKMQEAYEDAKDDEIKELEASISSQQKLYDMAIEYIESNWEDLKDTLINWNYEYGSVLTDELVSAWDSALDAAKEYGSYLEALQNIQDDIDDIDEKINSSSGGSKYDNFDLGETPSYDHEASDEDHIRSIVGRMKTNSQTWHSASKERQAELSAETYRLGTVELAKYGITAVRGSDGVWYIDHEGGEQLYKVYHTGGIVGGGDIKSNEQFALLKEREWVLSENMVDNLTRHMSLMAKFANFAGKLLGSSGLTIGNRVADIMSNNNQRILSAANSRAVQISIGDTYISGMPEDTIKQHQDIARSQVNKIFEYLNIKR